MRKWWAPSTMRGYRSSWLSKDALASLALVAIALPSQMATARLAGVPVVFGLYAFVAGTVLYALIGTNRHLSVGADSTIAPVLAVGVASIAVVGTSRYMTVMALAALLIGVVLIMVGVLRLGWIAEFLSTPVIGGVLGGIAVEIVVRQLPSVLGVSGGGTSTIGRISDVVSEVGSINGWSVGIAVGTFVLIAGGRRIDRRLPGALLSVVLSIVLVGVCNLVNRHGVETIGHVNGGVPHVAFPKATWADCRQLIGPVLTVAFLCIAQTAAIARRSNASTQSSSDFNRDLIGIGAGSIAAGFIGAIAVDAIPPNTIITAASGGRSQLTNVFAASVVAVAILTLTGPLANLPLATLGATLIFIALKLFSLREFRTVFRFDRIEFALSALTLLVVALIGIEQGVILAMIVSLADRTRRSARPRDTLLGREPGTDHWIPVDIDRETEQVPGVLVYLVYAPLWYGNAHYLRFRIQHLVDAATVPIQAVIVDADGMSDIDFTGLQTLRDLAAELAQHGTSIAIARASHLVHHDLKHGALLAELGSDHLFTSVEDAVASLGPSS